MAGRARDFPAAEFRREIRATMAMGLPNAVAARPTFRWDPRRTYATASSTGVPFDLSAAPLSVEQLPDVQVPCAVEYLDAAGQPIETPVGNFHPDRARLTLLDLDWRRLVVDGRRFDEVVLDGTPYRWDKALPTVALFDVDVHQVVVAARDES